MGYFAVELGQSVGVGGPIDASDVVSGQFDNARISESNVTQYANELIHPLPLSYGVGAWSHIGSALEAVGQGQFSTNTSNPFTTTQLKIYHAGLYNSGGVEWLESLKIGDHLTFSNPGGTIIGGEPSHVSFALESLFVEIPTTGQYVATVRILLANGSIYDTVPYGVVCERVSGGGLGDVTAAAVIAAGAVVVGDDGTRGVKGEPNVQVTANLDGWGTQLEVEGTWTGIPGSVFKALYTGVGVREHPENPDGLYFGGAIVNTIVENSGNTISGSRSGAAGIKGGGLYVKGGSATVADSEGGDLFLYAGTGAGTSDDGKVQIGGYNDIPTSFEIELLRGYSVLEEAGPPLAGSTPGKGQFWVSSTTHKPMFRDHLGVDVDLTAGTGTGNVNFTSGTVVANQIALYGASGTQIKGATTPATIDPATGDAVFGNDLTVTNDLFALGNVTASGKLSLNTPTSPPGAGDAVSLAGNIQIEDGSIVFSGTGGLVDGVSVSGHVAAVQAHGLPAIPGSSTGKGLRVNATNDGYELFTIGVGTGDVTFTSSTVVDNQIARFDTSGNAIQGGSNGPTIDDSGEIQATGIQSTGNIETATGSDASISSDGFVYAKTFLLAEGGLYFPENAGPLFPGATAGFGQIYYKNTGEWIGVDEAGAETVLGAGAAGPASPPFTFTVAHTGAPSSGQIGLVFSTGTDWNDVTEINLADVDSTPFAFIAAALELKVGDYFVIRGANRTDGGTYQITSTPVDEAGYFTFGVTRILSSGTTATLGQSAELHILTFADRGTGGSADDITKYSSLGRWARTGTNPPALGEFYTNTISAATTTIIRFHADPADTPRIDETLKRLAVGTILRVRSVQTPSIQHSSTINVDGVAFDGTTVTLTVTPIDTQGAVTWSGQPLWALYTHPGEGVGGGAHTHPISEIDSFTRADFEDRLSDAALITDLAGDIDLLPPKGSVDGADTIMINDSAAAGAAKKVAISTLSVGVPLDLTDLNSFSLEDLELQLTNAQLITDQDGEIDDLPLKVSPASADTIMINDSAAAGAAKRVTVGSLGTGGGGATVGLGTWTKGANAISGAPAPDTFDVSNATIIAITNIRILASNPLSGAPISSFCGGLSQRGTLILQDVANPGANSVVFNVTSHVLTAGAYWDLSGTVGSNTGANWATSYSAQYIPSAAQFQMDWTGNTTVTSASAIRGPSISDPMSPLWDTDWGSPPPTLGSISSSALIQHSVAVNCKAVSWTCTKRTNATLAEGEYWLVKVSGTTGDTTLTTTKVGVMSTWPGTQNANLYVDSGVFAANTIDAGDQLVVVYYPIAGASGNSFAKFSVLLEEI